MTTTYLDFQKIMKTNMGRTIGGNPTKVQCRALGAVLTIEMSGLSGISDNTLNIALTCSRRAFDNPIQSAKPSMKGSTIRFAQP